MLINFKILLATTLVLLLLITACSQPDPPSTPAAPPDQTAPPPSHPISSTATLEPATTPATGRPLSPPPTPITRTATSPAPTPPQTAEPLEPSTHTPHPTIFVGPTPVSLERPEMPDREPHATTETGSGTTRHDILTADEAGAASPVKGEDRDLGSPRRHGQPSPLKAGEVDDNKLWADYLEFLQSYQGPPVHKLDVSQRHIITVLNERSRPVPDAQITVSANGETLFEGRTYADGRTLFFPKALHPAADTGSFTVQAQKNGAASWTKFQRGHQSDWTVTLDDHRSYQQGIPLDILFLLDSTGSMADEINRIKETLVSISRRVHDLPSRPDLRFGMVTYRDLGDDYVTQTFDFDHDVRRFTNTVRNVSADGGGDYPESLNEALHQTVNHVSWRTDNAVRLVFLLADAPPHLDYPQDYDYIQSATRARNQGIKVFAVASSGLDQQGEYIFRQIAQQTMGRFIFILYETGPQGHLDTPHNVEDFTVDRLDSLIVRLIQEELGELNQP